MLLKKSVFIWIKKITPKRMSILGRATNAFLADYRNQMTHRVSPNISSITMLGTTLRPPTLYVLHRAIEDYYQVSSYLCQLINQYLEDHKDWLPIGMSEF